MRKIALLLVSFIVCTTALADNGVSLRLAQYRSATVSDVSYQLHITIPDSLSQSVTGTIAISFKYDGGKDLPLDFTGKLLKNRKNVWGEINGKNTNNIRREDEHVVLPAKSLRKGLNTVRLAFASSNASLNRHQDYMYTLFVPANARSCFPCFDQPNLKARFSLDLRCPQGWETLCSADSHPIPTYLFSFVAGKFKVKTATRDGRTLTALYRETDPQKVAQLGKVFDEAALSIKWMEAYTSIKLPFDSYGFVVLPGYQFGGMEHPGAIQFTDREIFLGPNPTPDEELTRLELIAHETAHLWFGDMVTMRWFDDVWTKEVFANFLANKVSRKVYPNINHDLNFLKSYQRPALAVDRTDGTHPIQQPLDNLKDAGLLYGNIIYDKAPVMMRKLEEQMSPDKLRDGLRAYLRKYSYGNATWDDLIGILDSVVPQARLKQFSEVWVKRKGLPVINAKLKMQNAKLQDKSYYDIYSLTVSQTDPYGRGLLWPQRFTIAIGCGDSIIYKEVSMDKAEVTVPLAMPHYMRGGARLYPNADGRGYGQFVVNDNDMEANISLLTTQPPTHGWKPGASFETATYSTLLNLHENFLMGRLSGKRFFKALCDALDHCGNPLTGSTIVGCMGAVSYYAADSTRHAYERQMLRLATTHKLRPLRQQLLRTLATSASDSLVIMRLHDMWLHQKDTTVLDKDLLSTRDYTRMAWHLAIMMPGEASGILSTQRTMLKTEDERREFDYVSRACTADTATQKRLFHSLMPKEGRTVEPWARQTLALLCDRSREPLCNSYIQPGLDHLLEIQQSSDIFFPGYWLSSLLTNQHSPEAQAIVSRWISSHPDYPQSLMNKLKQSVFGMFCKTKE